MKIVYFFLGLLFLLTGFLTYPSWLHLSAWAYGIDHPDHLGTLYNFWWLQFSGKNGLDPHQLWIGAPFVWDSRFMIYQPLWTSAIRFLGLFVNHIATFNILSMLSFPLTFLTTYYLLKHLTKDKCSSCVGSFMYTFSAYHLARSLMHLTLAHVEWIPLAFLSLILIYQKPSIKRGIFCGLIFTLVGISEFYYIYFMGIIALFFFFMRIILRKITLKELGAYGCALLVFGVVYIGGIYWHELRVLFFEAPHNPALKAGLYEREFRDLFRFSAKPLSYFMPYAESFLFGKLTHFYAGSPLFGYNDVNFWEQVIFIGFTPLALAIYGVKQMKIEYKNLTKILGILMVFIWVASFSPYWEFESFKIYFPSYFLYKIFPIVRSYGRISIFLELCIIVFAAFGIKRLLMNRGDISKAVITTCILLFVILENFHVPPWRYKDLSRIPDVYTWLKDQPGDFVVAEYPLILGDMDIYKTYYQTHHHKKLLNGCRTGSVACEKSQRLVRLSDPHVPSYLKGLGIQYVILHKKDYKDRDATKIHGLKFIRKFDNDLYEVYEVSAEPLNL